MGTGQGLTRSRLFYLSPPPNHRLAPYTLTCAPHTCTHSHTYTPPCTHPQPGTRTLAHRLPSEEAWSVRPSAWGPPAGEPRQEPTGRPGWGVAGASGPGRARGGSVLGGMSGQRSSSPVGREPLARPGRLRWGAQPQDSLRPTPGPPWPTLVTSASEMSVLPAPSRRPSLPPAFSLAPTPPVTGPNSALSPRGALCLPENVSSGQMPPLKTQPQPVILGKKHTFFSLAS